MLLNSTHSGTLRKYTIGVIQVTLLRCKMKLKIISEPYKRAQTVALRQAELYLPWQAAALQRVVDCGTAVDETSGLEGGYRSRREGAEADISFTSALAIGYYTNLTHSHLIVSSV